MPPERASLPHPATLEGNEVDVLKGKEWRESKSAWVSSLGWFKSTKGVVSTPKPARSGYVSVTINRKRYLLHRLMVVAFGLRPDSEAQTTVDHRDGNRGNNRLENLRWATHSEQQRYSHASGTRASSASRLARVQIRGRQRARRAPGGGVDNETVQTTWFPMPCAQYHFPPYHIPCTGPSGSHVRTVPSHILCTDPSCSRVHTVS